MKWEKDDSREYQRWLRNHSGYKRKHGVPHWEPKKPITVICQPPCQRENTVNFFKPNSPQLELIREQKELEQRIQRYEQIRLYNTTNKSIKDFMKSDIAFKLPDMNEDCKYHDGLRDFVSKQYVNKSISALYAEATKLAIAFMSHPELVAVSVGYVKILRGGMIIIKHDKDFFEVKLMKKMFIYLNPIDQNSPSNLSINYSRSKMKMSILYEVKEDGTIIKL